MTKHKEWDLGAIDLLVGGTPCQSFSVAGLRKGLDDPRGNLMLTYLAIADQRRPRWLVWENVPGVLSSNGGKDFGTFLGALAELGYGFAYRVLDAQYFGVAQRRRRVFVVGYLGDWRPAAAVLFEPESLRGDTAPSREKGKATAGTVTTRSGSSSAGGIGTDEACGGYLQPAYGIPGNWIGRQPENGGNSTQFMEEVAPCLTGADKHGVAQPIPINSMNAMRSPHADASTGCGVGDEGEAMFTLTKGNHHAVAQPIPFDTTQITSPQNGSNPKAGDPCHPLAAGAHIPAIAQPIPFGVSEQPNVGHCLRSGASKADKHESTTYIAQSMAVRRLTPVECERLQGFPDNYTNIPWRKADQSPDGPRYKALGNSMAVPVMHWIGRRISVYENIVGNA